MSLPTSGPLSFSDIASVVGVGSPYSLGTMSANAGFTQPDSVSEFYGYGPGGLTAFYRTPDSDPNPTGYCFNACSVEAYHNGVNPLPTIGDIVYNDSGGVNPIFSVGGYWGMSELQYEQATVTFTTFKREGNVLDIQFCFFEPIEEF